MFFNSYMSHFSISIFWNHLKFWEEKSLCIKSWFFSSLGDSLTRLDLPENYLVEKTCDAGQFIVPFNFNCHNDVFMWITLNAYYSYFLLNYCKLLFSNFHFRFPKPSPIRIFLHYYIVLRFPCCFIGWMCYSFQHGDGLTDLWFYIYVYVSSG